MHNLRLDRLDGRSIQQNFLVTNQHMDAEHYIRWYNGMDLYRENASLGHQSLRDHYVVLADTGSPVVQWKLFHGELWLDGLIETTLYYSGSVNSTANFSLTMRAHLQKVGTNVTSMAASFTTAQSFAGPATAGDVLSSLRTQYLPVTREHLMSSWVLNRNVADANTGELWLLAIRQRYIPKRHEV